MIKCLEKIQVGDFIAFTSVSSVFGFRHCMFEVIKITKNNSNLLIFSFDGYSVTIPSLMHAIKYKNIRNLVIYKRKKQTNEQLENYY